ncbi:hypothetical protein ACFE04_005486 [Oxalis oulophora]
MGLVRKSILVPEDIITIEDEYEYEYENRDVKVDEEQLQARKAELRWKEHGMITRPAIYPLTFYLFKQISTLLDPINKYWPSLISESPSNCHDGRGSFWGHEFNTLIGADSLNMLSNCRWERLPPKFYGEPLNCLKLWRTVIRLGGYELVTACKLWRQVGESFHPPKFVFQRPSTSEEKVLWNSNDIWVIFAILPLHFVCLFMLKFKKLHKIKKAITVSFASKSQKQRYCCWGIVRAIRSNNLFDTKDLSTGWLNCDIGPLFRLELYTLPGCFSQWVHSCFSFAADPDYLENNIREKQDLDALGCGHYIPWASLNFEEGTVGMDVTITGTNGTLHDASFTTNSKSGFTDIVSEWNPTPSEHVGTTKLSQDDCTVKEFS